MEIERLEDWVGQQVVDADGEKAGKLDDVFYAPGGNDAVAVSVKSGMLGRKLRLVPLDGARVTRDHVKVAHGKDAIDGAPEAPAAETDLPGSTVTAVARHFDVTLTDGELESGAARAARVARAREAEQRAEELERVAEAKKSEAEHQNQSAAQSREAAAAAEEERQAALNEAAQARRDAGAPNADGENQA